MNGYENEAAKKAMNELTEICSSNLVLHANKFQESVSDFEKKYAILYSYFQQDVKNTLCFERLLQLLLQTIQGKVKINLGREHIRLKTTFHSFEIEWDFRTVKNDFLNFQVKSSLKRIRSKFQKRVPRKTISQQTHICIVCFNTPSDYFVYYKVLDHLKTIPDVHVSIVEIDSGIHASNAKSLRMFASDSIDFYTIESFSNAHPAEVNYLKFKKELALLNDSKYGFGALLRYTNEVFYSTFEKVLQVLDPSIVWYNNTSEIGRCLALVGNFMKKPVICIDYALFSNDFLHMASRIRFTARFCISEYTSGVWKNKADPTPVHQVIGLLKLDNFQSEHPPKTVSDRKTLFFASTWGGTNPLYNQEKKELISQLAAYCKTNNFRLIVKKHPAENDGILEAFKSDESDNFKIYAHDEISMYEAMAISDIAITQNSSIAAEAMLYAIPTVYFNQSTNENTKAIIAINDTEFVFYADSIEQLNELITSGKLDIPKSVYDTAIAYYLYKIDGKAYLRLIEETLKLKTHS